MLEAAQNIKTHEVPAYQDQMNIRLALMSTLKSVQPDNQPEAPQSDMYLLKEEMAEFAREYSESKNPTQDDYDALNEMAGCNIECEMELDPNAVKAIRDVYQKLLEMPAEAQSQIFSLHMEGYLLGHATRVAIYSALLAQKLNEDVSDEYYIDPALAATAGFLHDIGKMHERQKAISETEGRLTNEQYEEMKEHPEYGAKVLRYLKNYEGGRYLPIHIRDYRTVYNAALNHHVRYDGGNRSYPQYVKPEDTSRLDGIIGVADSFDAMASGRSYVANRNDIDAQVTHGYSEVEKYTGAQFDPVAAQAFCELRPMPRFNEVEELMAA